MIFFLIFEVFILFCITCWFVFSLLGAIEKIVRGVKDGKTEEELNYTSEAVQAGIALAILFGLIIFMLGQL